MKLHLEKLKDFDAYYKPIEDYHEKTFVGGTVSILCWVTIILLSSLRCYEFFTTKEVTQTIFVDSSRSPKLWINLDIIVHRISCDYIALDAMDSSGEQHLHIDHNIYKRRLDSGGKPIEEPKKEEVKTKSAAKAEQATTTIAPPKCGSCYGAEDINNDEKFNITCCNTCEEVKEAYRKRRWQLTETKIDQCKSSATSQQIKRAFEEGCQVYGYMEVNRVSGNFHIAPGHSFTLNHIHVHDVQPFTSSQFNTSHTIRHLSFAKDKVVGNTDLPLNPLDGSVSTASEGE
ncbi:endoplasmic reticulum-Golgi intermediate compartment protein [Nesidiocoris tenuis]|uniref:Endoplasmic reticulum-Golgi intermediate compartment protein 3 n=1 Tax=Nesidiocoris tenuis TaxID=355587 RepID=A0ABN7A891_9HEMI|nr:endoplasmic reticulum-Golgi intermediate compartment protein [Nesidiocoris tenuis]